jgi:hypothetical protein
MDEIQRERTKRHAGQDLAQYGREFEAFKQLSQELR